jgi:hypothetical protein
MPNDLQEAEVTAGGVHLGGHRPLSLRTALVERGEVDDGDRAGNWDAHGSPH